MNDAHDQEPAAWTLARIEASFELFVGTTCRHCRVETTVVERDGILPRVLGVDHERGCPDRLDEDAMPAAVVQPRPEGLTRFDTPNGYDG